MTRLNKMVSLLGMIIMFSACNPKPEVAEVVYEEEKTYSMIDHPEKLSNFDNVFDGETLLGPLNRLAHYYDSEATIAELSEIGIRYLDGKYSVMDALEVYKEKGFIVYPTFTTYEEVERAVRKGKPVYATFTLMGSNSYSVIFTGYSDDELVMIDLSTGNDRAFSKKNLATVTKYDAFIPYKNGELADEELESSVRYLDMAISDSYFGNHGERMYTYIKLVEEKSLENEVNAFKYIKSYYYTFFDRKLEITEPLLKEDMETFMTAPHFELAFIIAHEHRDDEKMKSILSQWQILPFYQDETLKLIIEKGNELGFPEKSQKAQELLRQRLDRESRTINPNGYVWEVK